MANNNNKGFEEERTDLTTGTTVYTSITEPTGITLEPGEYFFYDMQNPKDYQVLTLNGIKDWYRSFWENDGGDDDFETEEEYEAFIVKIDTLTADELLALVNIMEYWFDDNEEDFLAHVASTGGW
jgi:hypothetical protein